MANPRQRRKVRSSSYRPVKQSRRANKLLRKQASIKGPKVLQDAWDSRRTVRQNYSALGLAHSLTPSDSGGRDITWPVSAHSRQIAESIPEEDRSEQAEKRNPSNNDISDAPLGRSSDGKLPRGFGRIIRDAYGTVIDVVLAGEEEYHAETEGKDGELDYFQHESSDEQSERIGVPHGSGWLLEKNSKEPEAENEGAKDVLQALEMTSKLATKRARVSSSAEKKYLSRLVETYGIDYQAMEKDRKRNVNQYTSGQLKRAIEKAGLGPR